MLIFVDVILSYLPQYQSKPWRKKIKFAADITCKPVRRLLPPNLPFDFSPIAVFVFFRLFIAVW
jgi:uncharacterized protein YggT (Ycf19 family)